MTSDRKCGIMEENGEMAIGSCFGPIGTVVGFVVGGVACVFVNIFVGNWVDELIDSITK